jgi:hypothetical protein
MLYTEGNLRAEDEAFRRIARSKIRAALESVETKTATLLDSLVSRLSGQTNCDLALDRLLEYVEQHPLLRSESAEIERYMNAFPELSDAVFAATRRIRSRARRQLERSLAPLEYQRRFRFTKGLSHS